MFNVKGHIKILENGTYVNYRYYDKITFEVEQILILNMTPAKDTFILEYIIKTNIKSNIKFTEFFKQLENQINTLSFFKNNFKYI